MLCLILKENTITTLAIAAQPTIERDMAENRESSKEAQIFFALLIVMFIAAVLGVALSPLLTIGAGLVTAAVTVATVISSVRAQL